MARKSPKKILFADDDLYTSEPFIERLQHEGYRVVTARSAEEAIASVRNHQGRFDLVILDIMMPRGQANNDPTLGVQAGLWAAKELKQKYRNLKLMGLSGRNESSLVNWFEEYGVGYLSKPCMPSALLDRVHRAIYGKARRRLKPFVVHGHDESTLSDLCKFLNRDSLFADPVVLRDTPDQGRTIIEKFEREADGVDIAFILLTPDDTAYPKRLPNKKRRRSRQNVIFELGYFFAKFQRHSGRVILLHDGHLELPTDIAGIVYIDISSGGIRSAIPKIKKEVQDLL